MTSRPPVGASCYTVEEFLPAGVTPMNLTDGGLWNSNTLTIKWGPFLDDSLRALRYDPVGAFASYQTSTRISVDGVNHTLAGVRAANWLRRRRAVADRCAGSGSGAALRATMGCNRQ